MSPVEIAAGWSITGGVTLACGVWWGQQLYRWRLRRTLRRISEPRPVDVEPIDPARLARFLERQRGAGD